MPGREASDYFSLNSGRGKRDFLVSKSPCSIFYFAASKLFCVVCL